MATSVKESGGIGGTNGGMSESWIKRQLGKCHVMTKQQKKAIGDRAWSCMAAQGFPSAFIFFFFFAFLIIGAKTEYVKKELEGARRLQTVSESRGQPGAVWGLVRFEPEHPHHR